MYRYFWDFEFLKISYWTSKDILNFIFYLCSFSQGLHWDTSKLTMAEKHELWKRRWGLLIYILRSPLYDFCTKKCIVGVFMIAKPKIPFGSHFSEFLSRYVPHYRKIYTYLWSRWNTDYSWIADLCFVFSWLRKARRVVSSGIAASPTTIICLEFQPF